MIVLEISSIIFRGSDDHTVGYRKKVFEYLSGNKENDNCTNIERSMRDVPYKMVVAATREEAYRIMRKQVADTILAAAWMNPNLNDFYFDVLYADIKDGLFWRPAASDGKLYRVSDLKVWKVQ